MGNFLCCIRVHYWPAPRKAIDLLKIKARFFLEKQSPPTDDSLRLLGLYYLRVHLEVDKILGNSEVLQSINLDFFFFHFLKPTVWTSSRNCAYLLSCLKKNLLNGYLSAFLILIHPGNVYALPHIFSVHLHLHLTSETTTLHYLVMLFTVCKGLHSMPCSRAPQQY